MVWAWWRVVELRSSLGDAGLQTQLSSAHLGSPKTEEKPVSVWSCIRLAFSSATLRTAPVQAMQP
jgi:hypothetical protein